MYIGDIVVFGVEVDDFKCDDVTCSDVFSSVHCAVRALPYDFEFLWLSAALRGEDAPGRATRGRRLCALRGVRRGSALPRRASCVVLRTTKKKRSSIGYSVGNLRLEHGPPPPPTSPPSFLPIQPSSGHSSLPTPLCRQHRRPPGLAPPRPSPCQSRTLSARSRPQARPLALHPPLPPHTPSPRMHSRPAAHRPPVDEASTTISSITIQSLPLSITPKTRCSGKTITGSGLGAPLPTCPPRPQPTAARHLSPCRDDHWATAATDCRPTLFLAPFHRT